MKRPKYRYYDPIYPNKDPQYTQEDMLLDSDMQQSLREWFSFDLPDDVAYAIHRFLYDISALFERTYEDEILHFIEQNQLDENQLHSADSIHTDPDDEIPWVDDEIEF